MLFTLFIARHLIGGFYCANVGVCTSHCTRSSQDPPLVLDDSGPHGTVCPFVASIFVFCTYYLLPFKSYKFAPFRCRRSKFLYLPNALSVCILLRVLQVWLSRHTSYNSVLHLGEILLPSELCLSRQSCSLFPHSIYSFRQACCVRPNGSHRGPQPQSYLSHWWLVEAIPFLSTCPRIYHFVCIHTTHLIRMSTRIRNFGRNSFTSFTRLTVPSLLTLFKPISTMYSPSLASVRFFRLLWPGPAPSMSSKSHLSCSRLFRTPASAALPLRPMAPLATFLPRRNGRYCGLHGISSLFR